MTKARDLGDNAQNTKPKVVDAKGDLIVGTGADAAGRLAAPSESGSILVANSAAATGLSYKEDYAAGKNKIINGDFSVNQRAFTSTTSSATFTFDRWITTASGGTSTYTAQTFTLGAAPVAGYEGKNYIDIDTTGQSAAADNTRIITRMESVRTLAGQTATVSFWAKAASGTPSVAIDFSQTFGTGGSPSSAVVGIGVTKFALTTSWTRYSVTVSVPSISGKTLGTNNNDHFSINFFTSAGSNFSSRTDTLGTQTATISLWGVQIEAGSVATAFQTATGTLQGELAACQRYYYRTTATQAYSDFGSGYNKSTTEGSFMIPFPVTMRTTPTALEQSGTASNYNILHQSGGAAARTACSSVPTYQVATPTMGRVDFIVSSGLTAGNGAIAGSNNNTTAYLGWSAEL
jgi:hypothetical protein